MKKHIFFNRIFLGIGANIINQFFNFLYQFACIAIFVYYWGESYYGEWLLIYSFCQYLTMGDIGISATLSNKITNLIENKEFTNANKYFTNGWFLLSIFSIFFFLIILLLIVFFQKNQYNFIKDDDLFIFLFFILFYVLIFIQINLFSGIYTASLQFAKQKHIDTIAKILEFSIILFCLILEGKAIMVSFGMLISKILIFIYILIDINKNFKWFSLRVSFIKQQYIFEVIKPSLANMFLNLGALMYYNGPTILVGYYLGNSVVPKYYALMTIIRSAKQLPLLINLPLYPEYARLIGLNRFNTAKNLHKAAILLTFFTALSAVIFLFFFSDIILGLLFKNVYVINPFFQIALIALLVQCIWHGSSVLLVGSNKHIKLAFHFALSSIIGYIIIIVTIHNLQLTAVSLGLLTIDLLMLYSTFKQVFSIINENLRDFLNIRYKEILSQIKILKYEK
ncbi:MAG: oligosaccharide flippase family protein [Spirosomataceae bacterium]